jgi:DNA-binding SARP family transcriptional activator
MPRWRYVSITLPTAAAPSVSEGTRVQLCGRLSVELGGDERASALRGKQVPLLFAYLVFNRHRPVGRDELIGALWPDQAPRSQDAALRTLLSRLRSAMGASVLAGRDELVLDLPEPVWVDVEAAAAHVESALEALRRRDARRAWALAQVPLNIAGRGLFPGAQATWLERRRRELDDLRLQALEIIGRAGMGLGSAQLGSVKRAAQGLIEAEPYRESGYVLLMEALEAEGNVAEALRIFERLRALLRDELGITPSPYAIAAHERLVIPGQAPAERSAAIDGAHQGEARVPLPVELRAQAAATMLGRETELAELERWTRGAAEEPAVRGERLMLLSGDPGVGKTRLLAEVASRAHTAGTLVLAGRATDENLVPFQPFLEALGGYVETVSLAELRVVASRTGAELSRLIPELRRRLPELPPPEDGDSETERYRLFESVVDLLRELSASASAPVLIVLDDLHAADRPTLMLLRHLARASRSGSVSILGAYRATDRWSEGFGSVLAGLRHERLLRQLDIEGLPEPEAKRLVSLRVGRPPSAEFSRALYQETEGNPFFIEEIVRHLTDAGIEAHTAGAHELHAIGLPDDVREVISRRLDRLSADAVETMRVASVIGRDFGALLLERVLGLDEERFLRSLEESLNARLVCEHPSIPDRYSFGHALIRETLYGGMSTERRARLHRRVGLALEGDDSEAHTNELALHFTRAAQAQDAERAVRYAVQAGEQAAGMLAHDQAAEHYENALSVLQRFAPRERRRRCQLLLELGEARIRSGERPRAWGVFREAATLAAEFGDSDSLARAAIGASRRFVQPPGVVDGELIALLQQALDLTPSEPSVTRVRLLNCLCAALYFSERREEMRRLSAEATVIAAELGDLRGLALAAAARRRAYWGPGHLERRLADSTQLLRTAREAGDLELTLQGHHWLVVDLLETGDRSAVDAQIEAFTAGASDLREPLFEWQITVWQAMLALLAGRLDGAERLATEALSSGIRSEGVTAPQYYAIQIIAIRREQLRMAELESSARGLGEANPGRLAWRAGLSMLLAETGQAPEARAELDRLAADGFADIPRDGDWLMTITLLADAAVALRDAERAQRLYELLLPQRGATVVVGLGAVCLGSTARYLGRLALTMDDHDSARAHLEFALRSNAALRAPVELAHTRLDYARVVKQRSQARKLVADAASVAAELGLPSVARRAQESDAV